MAPSAWQDTKSTFGGIFLMKNGTMPEIILKQKLETSDIYDQRSTYHLLIYKCYFELNIDSRRKETSSDNWV